jgi:hypothetical protein
MYILGTLCGISKYHDAGIEKLPLQNVARHGEFPWMVRTKVLDSFRF